MRAKRSLSVACVFRSKAQRRPATKFDAARGASASKCTKCSTLQEHQTNSHPKLTKHDVLLSTIRDCKNRADSRDRERERERREESRAEERRGDRTEKRENNLEDADTERQHVPRKRWRKPQGLYGCQRRSIAVSPMQRHTRQFESGEGKRA